MLEKTTDARVVGYRLPVMLSKRIYLKIVLDYITHTIARARIRRVRAKYAGFDAQKTYDVGGQGVSKTGIFYSFFFTRCRPPSTSSDEIRGEGRSYTSLWILKIVTKPSAIVFAFSVQQAACVECGLRQNAYRVQRTPRTPLPYGQG